MIAYRTALALDVAKYHPDATQKEAANRWCALVTPVLKAAWTDQAFSGASACLQVFGGHGYVREWGIEQHVRDARVAMIYEGTNEIQAIDLLVRKVLPDGATGLLTLLKELAADLPERAPHGKASQALSSFASFVSHELLAKIQANNSSPDLPYWLADDFLRTLAVLLMACAWERVEATAGAEADRWRSAHHGFWRWVWPEFDMRIAMMRSTLSVD